MLGEGSASARGSTIPSDRVLRTFILKVASRCHFACPYCYVYFKGDATWKRRPPVMPDGVFDQTLERIQEYCTASGQSSVAITFHGGEPCLIGARRFDTWCSRARQSLRSTSVRFGIQTNGTLLDAEWAETLRRHGVRVGVSVDGPRRSTTPGDPIIEAEGLTKLSKEASQCSAKRAFPLRSSR